MKYRNSKIGKSKLELVIALLFILIFNTTSVTGITEPVPMTVDQINNLVDGGWKITGCEGPSMVSFISTRVYEDFYLDGHGVRLDFTKDDEEIEDVIPVGLRVYADIYKAELRIGWGYGDIDNNGDCQIKMRAPPESGYYKIEVYSQDLPSTAIKPGNSIALYVEPSPPKGEDSDGDGWTDAQETKAGTDPYKKDTDNDGYWDPQDPNPLDPTIPIPSPILTPLPPAPSPMSSAFEAIFAITGLLALAYLLGRRK